MEKINLILSIVIGIVTLIGFAFIIYRSYADPNKKQDEELAVGAKACELKHGVLDSNISEIKQTLSMIQENHLRHIEDRMGLVENNQTKIFTILEERLPRTNK
jgi:hypothetical protein